MNQSKLKLAGTMLAAMLFLATQPGASCFSDGGSSDPVDRDSDRLEDANNIPERADLVAEGRGDVSWTSDADGQVYVQDLKDEVKVLDRRITRGQKVRVSPDENRIRIDEDTVSKADLKKDHAHRIYIDRDRRSEDDRDERLNGVPSGAKLIDEGRNEEISFRASVDGRAYIYDTTARRVIDSADVRDGQRFVFSPAAGRATVDGKRVIERRFDSKVTYRIYFAR